MPTPNQLVIIAQMQPEQALPVNPDLVRLARERADREAFEQEYGLRAERDRLLELYAELNEKVQGLAEGKFGSLVLGTVFRPVVQLGLISGTIVKQGAQTQLTGEAEAAFLARRNAALGALRDALNVAAVGGAFTFAAIPNVVNQAVWLADP